MPREKLIQLRRGTTLQWATVNPTLDSGEAGLETDTNKLKFGDGVTDWDNLPYFSGEASNGKVKIGNLWFDTIGNTDVNAIEDGNTFEGFPTSGRYVVGEVLDATDFDVDDSTKAKLYIDNN